VAAKGWRALTVKALLSLLLISYILGPGVNILTFYADPNYQDDAVFNFFTLFGHHPQPASDIFGGFGISLAVVGLYLLYSIARETGRYYIERPGSGTNYRILFANRIGITAISYLAFAWFLITFKLTGLSTVAIVCLHILPPSLFIFVIGVYWIFPLKGDGSFFQPAILLRLVGSALLLAFPFSFFAQGMERSTFVISACIELFLVIPIAWMFYQQNKDSILELRGVENALVKSTTNLQFLRSQINPHFMFNSLNALYGSALIEGAGQTAGGIQKLGDMMRFMLHENQLDFILMEREIEYLENYISLQQLRTGNSPDIVIEKRIDAKCLHRRIAPMLLIPFVENAFKHGISLKEKSWIKILLTCNERNILFEVRNSMHVHPANDLEKDKLGIGLKNVQERLKLIYPGKYKFSATGDEKEFLAHLSIAG
jgi:hypothetical protein